MIFTSDNREKTPPLKAAVNLLILTVLIVIMFQWSLSRVGITLDFSFIGDYSVRLRDGFLMTVYLSLCSMGASLIIGVLAALGRSCKILIIKYLSTGYVGAIRGTPLILQIYLFFYVIGTAWGVENRFVAGFIILSVFEGAYIAEIVRGSFSVIKETQLEAAKAVGFDKRQTFKYVIFPQMTAGTLPALTGQFASVIKDSSLLSLISVIELTQTIREITADNFKFFEAYIFLGALYLCLTLPLALISGILERRFDYES